MTEIEKAIQEFEDEAYHHSLHPGISDAAKAVALAALLEKQERDKADKMKQLPVVGAAPVVHGQWRDRNPFTSRCSVCGEENELGDTNYCPNCGARMDLTEGEND